MAQFRGRVSKIFPSRFGGSFGLDGQQGLYFNTKSALPAFIREGVTVELEGEIGRNNKSVFVVEGSVKEVAQAPAPAGGGGGSYGNTQDAIKYQSARKDALVMVGLLVQTGALKLPEAPAKKAGVIEAAVDRFTAIYYEDIDQLGALARTPPDAPAEAPKAAKAAKPVAADDDDEAPE